jgi:MoxR-like ATPase
VLAAKARALLNGEATVAKDDIRALARPILRHRIITNFQADAQRITREEIIDRLIER